MNVTNGTDQFYHPKHRDDSNAAWGKCEARDRHRDYYAPKHAKPVPMVAVR